MLQDQENFYLLLSELGISYERFDHEPVFTCEQADSLYTALDAGKVKNLFLRGRKGDAYYLLMIPSEKQVDLKKLSEQLGEKSLGFASTERLLSVLGITPGSVAPFALINDTQKCVKVFIDEEVLSHDRLLLHPPGDNAVTLRVKTVDIERFVFHLGYTLHKIRAVSRGT